MYAVEDEPNHIDWLINVEVIDANKKELKNIKQKPTEWSEEDEAGLGNALWAIQQAKTIAKDENDMGNLWHAENWLKSLRPQNHWKPSDEQIKVLYEVIRNPHLSTAEYNGLIEFMEQLKKLKD